MGAGPGLEAADAVVDGLRGLGPIDEAVFFLEDGRVGGLGGVLGFGNDEFDAGEGFDQEIGAHGREAGAKFDSGLLRPDFGFGFEEHIAGVEASIDAHGGDTGERFAVDDGPLDGRGAAIFGQERGVDVDDSVPDEIDDVLRDDLAVTDNDHGVGAERAQMFDAFGAADALGLKDEEAEAERGFLDGRKGELSSPPSRTIGLRDDREHLVAGLDDAFERGDGERGGAEVDQLHQSHSPARCSFLILRFMRSRLRALMWV